jgi:hypothetical protein
MIQSIVNLIKTHRYKFTTIAAIILIFLLSKYFRSQTVDSAQQSAIPPVTSALDKNGKLLAVIRSQEIQILEDKAMIDSLANAIRVKPTEIKVIDRYIQRTDTVIRKEVIYHRYQDSVVIDKKDNYIDLHIVGKDSGLSEISLKHIDTLWRTQVEHHPFLKPAYTELVMRNASPYNKIVYGNSLTVRHRPSLVTLGPYLGWDFHNKAIGIGVGLQLPLLTIRGK